MKMTEQGMKEGLQRMERELAALGVRFPKAFEAAGFTALEHVLDRTRPGIPRVTGELEGSGFMQRTRPIAAGFGAPHAGAVHELDGGRGFKFLLKRVNADRAVLLQEQAALLEQYARAGITLETVPAKYPSTPAARPRPPAQRRREPGARSRAGARRSR
jgi:hypothetical protein